MVQDFESVQSHLDASDNSLEAAKDFLGNHNVERCIQELHACALQTMLAVVSADLQRNKSELLTEWVRLEMDRGKVNCRFDLVSFRARVKEFNLCARRSLEQQGKLKPMGVFADGEREYKH